MSPKRARGPAMPRRASMLDFAAPEGFETFREEPKKELGEGITLRHYTKKRDDGVHHVSVIYDARGKSVARIEKRGQTGEEFLIINPNARGEMEYEDWGEKRLRPGETVRVNREENLDLIEAHVSPEGGGRFGFKEGCLNHPTKPWVDGKINYTYAWHPRGR